MSSTATPKKPVKGNPASAQPMQGLSARAQKELAPRSAHYRYSIEPAGAALERHARMKGSI